MEPSNDNWPFFNLVRWKAGQEETFQLMVSIRWWPMQYAREGPYRVALCYTSRFINDKTEKSFYFSYLDSKRDISWSHALPIKVLRRRKGVHTPARIGAGKIHTFHTDIQVGKLMIYLDLLCTRLRRGWGPTLEGQEVSPLAVRCSVNVCILVYL